MIMGPRAAPESVNDRKVPTAVPSEEPEYSKAYVMVAGASMEVHVPQRIPTIINMERVSEKESIIMATSPTERNVKMILSLLHGRKKEPRVVDAPLNRIQGKEGYDCPKSKGMHETDSRWGNDSALKETVTGNSRSFFRFVRLPSFQ